MKPGQIKRGFKPLAEHVDGRQKYVADCKSCCFWNENDGCENPNYIPYDLIVEENRSYCIYWSV